ncbi:hypothetical protein HGI30_14170 [Paenibacillus albicereus]|uniref:Uncharacterized protein n=1 Tax=Paenibacillus albicereus TaxID=2726185 RepID=A0A6H2GZJ7_9BACL|nr:hypothetical protein [Paenibacillus albicereus]QJC52596.1 hypothetical protein HGI30_14170 [Paenibacillus albicereus]
MKKGPLKWTIVGAALAAVLMFGMEMTSAGIGRVYGPVEGSEPAEIGRYAEAVRELELQQAKLKQLEYEADLKRLQKKYGIEAAASMPEAGAFLGDEESAAAPALAQAQKEDWRLEGEAGSRLPGIADPQGETGVNRLADGTAGMLQSVSSSGIRFLVTLFDSMTQ